MYVMGAANLVRIHSSQDALLGGFGGAVVVVRRMSNRPFITVDSVSDILGLVLGRLGCLGIFMVFMDFILTRTIRNRHYKNTMVSESIRNHRRISDYKLFTT